MRQQHLYEIRVAVQNGRVQRRVPRAGRVRIRAVLQQERAELAVPAEAGNHQRGGAVGRRIVHVRARVEQQAGALDAALPRGEQQRREAAQLHLAGIRPAGAAFEAHEQRAALRPRVNGGAMLQEHPHDLRDSPCATAHISAVWPCDDSPALTFAAPCSRSADNCGRAAGARAGHEHRLPHRGGGVRIRAGGQDHSRPWRRCG